MSYLEIPAVEDNYEEGPTDDSDQEVEQMVMAGIGPNALIAHHMDIGTWEIDTTFNRKTAITCTMNL